MGTQLEGDIYIRRRCLERQRKNGWKDRQKKILGKKVKHRFQGNKTDRRIFRKIYLKIVRTIFSKKERCITIWIDR